MSPFAWYVTEQMEDVTAKEVVKALAAVLSSYIKFACNRLTRLAQSAILLLASRESISNWLALNI